MSESLGPKYNNAPVEEEMEVWSAIQQIALEHRRRYGYRRITGGGQYACAEYVAVLKKHPMTPSRSRPANPYDTEPKVVLP